MKKALNIVRGAVAEKELIPVLTNFHIYDGRVQGYNGRLAIDTACEQLKGVNITVPAEKFLKAISLPGELKFDFNDGHMLVRCGKLTRIKVPSTPNDNYPRITVAAEQAQPSPTGLIHALRALRPFVSTDASRPWSLGILLNENHAHATNNVTLVRYPLPWNERAVTLPSDAVDELLRIGSDPAHVHVDDKSVTFMYDDEGSTWLRAQVLNESWPDVSAFFQRVNFENLADKPEGLDEAVQTVMAFCPDVITKIIRFCEWGVSTREGQYSAEVGGYTLPVASFGGEHLVAALQRCDKFDASMYPAPAFFSRKDGLQGILAGVRE